MCPGVSVPRAGLLSRAMGEVHGQNGTSVTDRWISSSASDSLDQP